MTVADTKQGTKTEMSTESLTGFAISLTSFDNFLSAMIIITMNNTASPMNTIQNFHYTKNP